MKRLVLYVLLLVAAFPLSCPAWEGTVVRVADGDTLVVERAGLDGAKEQVTLRLYGIDAPEAGGRGGAGQPYGKEARRYLASLVAGGRVAVMDMGYDRYSRSIAGVTSLPDGNIAQEELLKAGLAWVYKGYCRDCRQWKALEQEARAARRGLWRDSDPTPPWVWRTRQQHQRAAQGPP